MRKFLSRKYNNISDFKQKLIKFCSEFEYAVVLNSNGYAEGREWFGEKANFELLAGIDAIDTTVTRFNELKKLADTGDWQFGYIGYDAKNEIEPTLLSKNADRIGFDEVLFFTPRFVIMATGDEVTVGYNPANNSETDALSIFENIEKMVIEPSITTAPWSINQTVSEAEYLKCVHQIKEHIYRGDIYEINYCMEFWGQKVILDTATTFNSLLTLSPTPFSAYLKQKNKYLLSASPERYIKRWGNKVISQPIKGTIKRGVDLESDNKLISELKHNPKEQAENIMITDLVRNDLAKVATRGSVKVEELMGVYSFPQVHQLISTISANVAPTTNWVDVLKATFPMGSMTGAPKMRAMQLIDEYEVTKRSLYSGAVGYVTPEGNFDFNVVIRSLFYNSKNETVSLMVGSAITASSKANDEYQECLLKASALLKVINAEL